MTYRALFTGSRHHRGKAAIWAALDAVHADHPDMLLVHGACYPPEDEHGSRPHRSADWLAHLWAIARGVPEEPHPADWARHGPAAGPIRNAEMVNLGADECLAAPLGRSPGTRGCAHLAQAAGIPVRWIRWIR